MSFPAKLNEWLGRFPSTNGRIALTLICVALTAISYCIAWEAPKSGWGEWLTFLGVMSGLDSVQFFAKRKTDATHVEAQAKARATVAIPKVEG
jgi:hypothetical protein